MKRPLIAILLGASVAALPACDGLFEGIYDQPAASEFGFVAGNAATRSGTIRIDATSYTAWNYIDLHARRIVTAEIGEAEPAAWDFAVHRYDAKTASGSVLETASTDFDALRHAGSIPSGDYVEDIWATEQIVTDMSHMMDGYLDYAPSYYNPELSKWLSVDTSTMPPIYTASNRVYVVRFQDGTHAALKLTDYMNDAGMKGYLTIDYIYPLEF